MTAYPIQQSFARGELSPRLHARVDIDHYRTGLALCWNFYTMRQGGLRRRPGSYFMGSTKFPDRITAIRPFIFSTSQSYAMELGDLYMRLFTAAGQIFSGPGPYEIATPWPAAAVSSLQMVQSKDVIYVTHKDFPPHKIKRRSEIDWEIERVKFTDGPYLKIVKDGTTLKPSATGNLIPVMTSNTAPSGIASASTFQAGYEPWRAFDDDPISEWRADVIAQTSWLQYELSVAKCVNGYFIQAATMAERHSVGGPDILTPGALRAPRSWTVEGSNDAGVTWTVLHARSGVTGWGDGERRYYSFINDEAFLIYRLKITDVDDSQSDPRYLGVSRWALSGGGDDEALVDLTVSRTVSVNDGAGFLASDVGRHVRLLDEDAVWHWYEIEERVSATVVRARLKSPPLPSSNRTTTFRVGAFSASSGWPAAIRLFQERLFYARTNAEPQTIWSSKRGDFEDFGVSTPLVDDDALTLTLVDAGEIQWLLDGADLIVGTTVNVRSIGPADKSKGFSATNFQQGRPARGGANATAPAPANDVSLFVGRYGNAIRELAYSFDANGYVAPDLSVLSEHILRPSITAMAYALDPNAIVWSPLGDGKIAGVTYEREQKMVAFHRHGLGGGGKVHDVCVTPGGDRDEVWFVSRRGEQQSILRMAPDFEAQPPAEAFYVDEGLTYRGAPVTMVGGLQHLAGEEVAVLANGAVELGAVVSSDGEVILPSGIPASVVHVGLPYESRSRTLELAAAASDGSSLGRKKRVKKVILSLFETGALKVKAAGLPEEIVLRAQSDFMDSPLPLVTGSRSVAVDDRWEHGGVIDMFTTDPLPATILAITPVYEAEP